MDQGATPSRVIDGRALEPPEPLVLTLDALDTLGAQETLLVLLDREPLPLYQTLRASGHTWQTRRGTDGSVEVLIWRMPD